jgi:hypothetical protein
MWVFVHMELPLAAVRATQASVGERVTLTWMTFRDRNEGVEERKEWTKEEIHHLQKITGPHLCRMIAEKGLQVCPRARFGCPCRLYF